MVHTHVTVHNPQRKRSPHELQHLLLQAEENRNMAEQSNNTMVKMNEEEEEEEEEDDREENNDDDNSKQDDEQHKKTKGHESKSEKIATIQDLWQLFWQTFAEVLRNIYKKGVWQSIQTKIIQTKQQDIHMHPIQLLEGKCNYTQMTQQVKRTMMTWHQMLQIMMMMMLMVLMQQAVTKLVWMMTLLEQKSN